MKIFLLAPPVGLDPNAKFIQPTSQDWLEQLVGFLEAKGHRVVGSCIRQRFGQQVAPEIEGASDFDLMKDSHLVMAYLGSPSSPYVFFDLGFAICFGKRIVILAESSSEVPDLQALPRLADTTVIRFDTTEDLMTKLDRLEQGVL